MFICIFDAWIPVYLPPIGLLNTWPSTPRAKCLCLLLAQWRCQRAIQSAVISLIASKIRGLPLCRPRLRHAPRVTFFPACTTCLSPFLRCVSLLSINQSLSINLPSINQSLSINHFLSSQEESGRVRWRQGCKVLECYSTGCKVLECM